MKGIAFAQVYDADVICVDLQERLLTKGLKDAKKRKLKLRVVHGDVQEPSKLVSGKFDLVTVLGQPLPHIGIFEFDQTIAGVKKILAKNGTFLIDQSDLIFRIIPQYRDAMTHDLEPPVFSIHRNFNARHGYFERLYYSRTRHDSYKTYLWAPWITGSPALISDHGLLCAGRVRKRTVCRIRVVSRRFLFQTNIPFRTILLST